MFGKQTVPRDRERCQQFSLVREVPVNRGVRHANPPRKLPQREPVKAKLDDQLRRAGEQIGIQIAMVVLLLLSRQSSMVPCKGWARVTSCQSSRE